jgi:hypothetical protein
MLGWFLVIYGALATLGVCWATLHEVHTARFASSVAAMRDSLSRGRWVQLRDGDTVVTVIRGGTYRWHRQ